MRHRRIWIAGLLVLATACGLPAAEPDARPGDLPTDGRNTDFRDARSCAGSGSGSGDGCGSGSGSTSVDASIDAAPCDLHTFTYQDAAAHTVWVTGSFTGWATMPPGALALTRAGSTWTVTTQVGPGRRLYKFIIDGQRWITDPGNPVSEADGVGGRNSVLVTCGGGPQP